MRMLTNDCGLCGQWHAHSQTLKLHYRSLHAAAFELDWSARKLAPRLGAAFNPVYTIMSHVLIRCNTLSAVQPSGRHFSLPCTMGFSQAQIDQQMEEAFGPHLLSFQYKRPAGPDPSAPSPRWISNSGPLKPTSSMPIWNSWLASLPCAFSACHFAKRATGARMASRS